MLVHSGDQQGIVGRPLVADLIMRNNLVLGLLYQDQLPKLIRLMGLAFADDLGVIFKQAESFVLRFGIAAHHALACLTQDLLDTQNHLVELLLSIPQHFAVTLLGPIGDFPSKLLGIAHHAAGEVDELKVGLFHLFLAGLRLIAASAG